MSIYSALLSCGISTKQADDMEFGLYIDIATVRAKQKKDVPERGSAHRDGKTITLKRGTIDQVPGW